jgi:hypothetical protein
MASLIEHGPSAENVINLTRQLAETTGPFVGGSAMSIVKQGAEMSKGIYDYSQHGDIIRLLQKVAGYTDYQVEKK